MGTIHSLYFLDYFRTSFTRFIESPKLSVKMAQPGYPPAYPQPVPVVQVVQAQPVLSFDPSMVTCPFCQQNVQTQVNYETGLLTYLAAGGLLLFGCWLGCCLIPCCINDCKDAQHTCPSCHKIIGIKKRIS